jgi:hypothetical protein
MADTVLPSTAAPPTAWPRWRVALIRVWAALLTLWALIMAQGILIIGLADPGVHFMFATSTVWKLLSLGGVAVVMATGGRNIAAYWAIAVGQLVWIIAAALVPQSDGNGILLALLNVALLYGPLIALRPHRRELLRPRLHPSRPLLTLAIAGAIPLVWYAVHLLNYVSGELGFDMVGLYLVLPGMAILAALQPSDGKLLGRIVGLGAALTGLAALVYPHDTASAGHVGGALLVLAGLTYATTNWIEQRRIRDGRGNRA